MKIIGLILLGLLLLLLLLLLLPVRLRVQYDGALQVHAGLGPVCLQLYPRKKRQKEPKKPRERKEKPISDEKKAKKAKKQKKTEILPEKPSLQRILALIRLGLKGVGAMLRPISVPRLQLAVQVGGRDAYAVAMTYGELAAGLSALYPVLQKSLRIRKTEISVDADFTAETVRLQGDVTFSACPLRYLIAACRILIAYLRLRRQEKQHDLEQNTQEKGGITHEQHQ